MNTRKPKGKSISVAKIVCAIVVVIVLCVLIHIEQKEQILFQTQTSDGTIVFVTRCLANYNCLKFGDLSSYRQSVSKIGDPDAIELPYARCLLMALVFAHDVNRVLVIGLGGGSIPNYIHTHYPNARIDIVDIYEELIDLQQKYFSFDIHHSSINTVITDGYKFLVSQPDNYYSAIFVDGGSLMTITNGDAELLQRKLAANGVVGFNCFYSDDWNRDKVQSLQKFFEEVWIFETTSVNSPLVATTKASLHTKQTLIQAAEGLEKSLKTKLPFSSVAKQEVAAKRIFSVKGL